MSSTPMEIKQAFLVIADISGYTRFVMMHTTNLLHAEMIITDLLEAVIAQSQYPLTIAKLEGDAVFLYAISDGDERAAARDILKQVTQFFEAFRTRERALIACNVCACDACRSIDRLKLKVVVHQGEVAIKQVREFTELAGRNVILIHRLLKNSIAAKEYILMTDRFCELSGGIEGETLERRTELAEDIGEVGVQVWYPPPMGDLPTQPKPLLPLAGTASAELYDRMNTYSLRRLSGEVERREFASLPDSPINVLSRMEYTMARVLPRIITTVYLALGGKR